MPRKSTRSPRVPSTRAKLPAKQRDTLDLSRMTPAARKAVKALVKDFASKRALFREKK